MEVVMTLAALFITSALVAQNVEQIEEVVLSQDPDCEMDLRGIHSRVSGTVMKNRKCGVYILAVVGGKELRLSPNNLPEEFKKRGEKIYFDYVEIGYMEGCKVDNRISISSVKYWDEWLESDEWTF